MPLETLLKRARERMFVRDFLRAAAAGLVVGAVVLVAARWSGYSSTGGAKERWAAFGATFVTSMVITAAFGRRRTRRAAVAAIEASDPSLRNLMVTAEQLLAQPAMTSRAMRDRVLSDAAQRSGAIDLARAVPLTREATACLLALGLGLLAATGPSAASSTVQVSQPSSAQVSKSSGFTIELIPPAYSGRQRATLSAPASIAALAGTRAVVRVTGATGARLRLNDEGVQLADGAATVVLAQSGYLAIESDSLNRLVPLTVTPDRAPDVRITAPAKDLRVSSAAATIPIRADAADDLGLASFELRYTVVSGTGEQFTFTEGTLPASVVRASDQNWRLEAPLSLTKLKLEPGDALISRAVATDKRPGDAGLASSDTFFIEVAGPGDVPLEGVEMPPDKERYALSQAMIVLKIERLMAREKSMARDALVEAAGNIAAEQRAVRANFIFLLGGEIEDEQVEAETSHEISEGRLLNQARLEIVRATNLMSSVEKALSGLSTAQALPPAREAVKALQRAFGHSRYLLRALPSRARIDPARRLSGDLSSARDWTRVLAPPASDPLADTARAALLDLIEVNASLVGATGPAADQTTRLARVAERLLAGGAPFQASARVVITAINAVAIGKIDEARAALARAAGPIVTIAQRDRIASRPLAPNADRLAGASVVSGGGR
jgi:hypothetical protein